MVAKQTRFRTLIQVINVYPAQREIVITIPAWKPEIEVTIPIWALPESIKTIAMEATELFYLHAEIDLSASRIDHLAFDKWEPN